MRYAFFAIPLTIIYYERHFIINFYASMLHINAGITTQSHIYHSIQLNDGEFCAAGSLYSFLLRCLIQIPFPNDKLYWIKG